MVSTLQSNVKSPKKLVEDAELSGELYLKNRKVKTLAPYITGCDLHDVTIVDCSFNCFCEIPVEICEWYCIKSLDLSHNLIKHVPEFLTTLCLIEVLNLSNNQITHLPSTLCYLKAITSLHLRNNKIVSLPNVIGKLDKCQMLDVSGNELNSLPPEIGRMSSLKHLDVSRNSLYSLPNEISILELVYLDASCNKIGNIPACFQNMNHLKTAMFDYNPLTSPSLLSLKKGRVHMFKSMQNQSLKNERQKEILEPFLPRKKERILSKAMDYSLAEVMESMYTESVNKHNLSMMSGDLMTTNNMSPTKMPLENRKKLTVVEDVTGSPTVNGNGIHAVIDSLESLGKKSLHNDLEIKNSQGKRKQNNSLKIGEGSIKTNQESPGISNTTSPTKFRQTAIKPTEIGVLENFVTSKRVSVKSKGIPIKSRNSPCRSRENSAKPKESVSKTCESLCKSKESSMKAKESSEKFRRDSNVKPSMDSRGINKSKRESWIKSGHSFAKNPVPRKAGNTNVKSAPVSFPGYIPAAPVKQKLKRKSQYHSIANASEKPNSLDTIRPQTASANRKIHSNAENDASYTIRRKTEKIYEELELLEQLRNEIETTLKIPLPQDLLPALTDGVVLCHLANHVKSRSVSTIHVPSPAVPKLSLAKCRRNVENFLDACLKLGVEKSKLCSYDDIMHGKGLSRIVVTVNELLTLLKSVNRGLSKKATSFTTPSVRITSASLIKQKSNLHNCHS